MVFELRAVDADESDGAPVAQFDGVAVDDALDGENVRGLSGFLCGIVRAITYDDKSENER